MAPDIVALRWIRQVKIEKTALFFEVRSSYFSRMDKNWLKISLRKAGKTSADLAEAIRRDRAVVSRIMNGHQPASIDHAKAFADVLEQPVDVVLERLGLTDAKTAAVFTPGFSESDAAQYVHDTQRGSDKQQSVAQALGADRPGIDTWTIRSDAMNAMGMLAGDFILVDTRQADNCKPGDVVIAQVYDWQTGSAITVVRRYEPPVLVAATTNKDAFRVHVIDGQNTVVRGKVIANWRLH